MRAETDLSVGSNAQYKEAVRVDTERAQTTSAPSVEMRTVATSLISGTLRLRYSPRPPSGEGTEAPTSE